MATAMISGVAARVGQRNGLGDQFLPGAFDQAIRTWSAGSGRPIPILSSHRMQDVRSVIGSVTQLTASTRQLRFEGEISDETPAGRDVLHILSQGYTRAVSLGYIVRDYRVVEAGWNVERADIVEVSMVVRGADPGAQVTSVRYSPDRDPE